MAGMAELITDVAAAAQVASTAGNAPQAIEGKRAGADAGGAFEDAQEHDDARDADDFEFAFEDAIEGDDARVASVVANFNNTVWEEASGKYGAIGLLAVRHAMMPIEKPPEMAAFKFLICPGDAFGNAPSSDAEQGDGKGRPAGAAAGRKVKGKGRSRSGEGRYVVDMGMTELMTKTARGQWWRALPDLQVPVLVRESFSVQSREIGNVLRGHYVQQSGPAEVFINGPAKGLIRMPVQPSGWVTVDATALDGPKYLEPVRSARWTVVFSTGAPRGDVIMREGVSLDSDEVAVLVCGAAVEQVGPQMVLSDGIVRMPISVIEGRCFEPSCDGSQLAQRPSSIREGWVTCDATAQNGPLFFAPCAEEGAMPTGRDVDGDGADDGCADGQAGDDALLALRPLARHRIYRVVNLEAYRVDSLPMVSRPEPYAPGSGRVPPEDIVLNRLKDGDLVEQIRHSKKVRGFQVMPVVVAGVEGWVTRNTNSAKTGSHSSWFEELRDAADSDREQRRANRRENRGPRSRD